MRVWFIDKQRHDGTEQKRSTPGYPSLCARSQWRGHTPEVRSGSLGSRLKYRSWMTQNMLWMKQGE